MHVKVEKDSSVLDLWMHHALDFVIDCPRATFCSAASRGMGVERRW